MQNGPGNVLLFHMSNAFSLKIMLAIAARIVWIFAPGGVWEHVR